MVKPVFVDTSAWIALKNASDPDHDDTKKAFDEIRSSGVKLVTSNNVLGETWTFMNRYLGHSAAVNFHRSALSSSYLEVCFSPKSLEEEAYRWLYTNTQRQFSFVDATSYCWMWRLGIDSALTLDADFVVADFSVIPT